MPLSVLTIGTVNHAPGIRVTIDTFKEHHPDAQLFTCLVDAGRSCNQHLDLPGVVFSAGDLDLPGGRRFLFKFTPFELCCALKPFATAYVLQRYGVERLVYLDSDMMLFAPMEESLAAGWTAASILCTPHFIAWPTDPPELLRQVRQCGTYNAGFLGVVNSPEALRFLTWWGTMCSTMGLFDPATGRFVDQIWLDLVVADRYGSAPLLDPGVNVGYWNLSERVLAKAGQTWLVNQERLKLFHFSGFNPDRLTDRRMFVPRELDLAIASEYAERLRQTGLQGFEELPYGFGAYENGIQIPSAHRRAIFRDDPTLVHVSDPFEATADPDIWRAMTHAAQATPIEAGRTRQIVRRVRDYARHAWRRTWSGGRDATP